MDGLPHQEIVVNSSSTLRNAALASVAGIAVAVAAKRAFSKRNVRTPFGKSEKLIGPNFIPFLPIEQHGVIGDRRTAALVAADGTIPWLCLPNYDSPPVFGALLDANGGGFWRLGPSELIAGRQSYREGTTCVSTIWDTDGGELELIDAMLWPQTERAADQEDSRAIIRRLTCPRGKMRCSLRLRPQDDFGDDVAAGEDGKVVRIRVGSRNLTLWSSVPLRISGESVEADFTLARGETAWAVLSYGEPPAPWSVPAACEALQVTEHYWKEWAGRLSYYGPRKKHVIRSAITFHLLTYAPTGSLVAAATNSLPERIGGNRNYDYRYAWIRDVSLSMAILSMLGDLYTAKRYMDWLSELDSLSDLPLQVMYRIDGGMEIEEEERQNLSGYRGSKPVRFGNHAYKQYQIDGLGYLADCSLIYLKQGGEWRPEYSDLIRRMADYVVENWHRPTNGIWELGEQQHFVVDKVMSWVTLERACKIAEKAGIEGGTDRWREEMEIIRDEVLTKGWSDELQSFWQRYDAETLDASILLMAVMEFLPATDPRMRATIERVSEALTIGGLTYRFDPQAQASPSEQPKGVVEGAFLPCTFWFAASLAMIGEAKKAEAILDRIEKTAGELRLFAEEYDPRGDTFLGNTPLLFSHAEYLKAVLELAKSRPFGAAELGFGQAAMRVRRLIGRGPRVAEGR